MDKPDISVIIEKVRNGSTYRELGTEYGVNASTICRWLAADEEIAQQSARAREDSAEAWLDRGMDYLERALSKESGLDPSAARALAQECARRAAIRNPGYRDGKNVELSGNPHAPLVTRIENVVIDPKG